MSIRILSEGMISEHWTDADGNPAGGITQGIGFTISWQNGPLNIDGVRLPQNGAFVEHLVEAVLDRMAFYQGSKFACAENAEAIGLLERALAAMHRRTADREARGVEGTHEL